MNSSSIMRKITRRLDKNDELFRTCKIFEGQKLEGES